MPLTDTAIRAAKPTDKEYKMSDGGGLYLLVHPGGGKYWRLKYRFDSREKKLALGVYPIVGLRDARQHREEAKLMLANGLDPNEEKKARALAGESFESVATAWFAQKKDAVSADFAVIIWRSLERDILPWIGTRAIDELKPRDVLQCLRRIERRGAREMAHRSKSYVGQIFRYAVAEGKADRDVTQDLKGALGPVKTKHMAALTEPKEVAGLLRAFDSFEGTFQVACALRLSPLLFCRPGELRKMEWVELDLDEGVWSIPGCKMKMGRDHIVPLSRQAVEILSDLKPLTGRARYVFPGARDPKRPMSDAAVNAALRRMGFDTQTEITGHGFRAMARTLLHERLGVDPAIIEHQLAHRVPDALGEAYNRTKFLPQRHEMMQKWADYLDELKAGAKVIRLPRRS